MTRDGTAPHRPTEAPSARAVYLAPERNEDDQRQLEDRFFKSLRMPNWTHKETRAGRLVAFDELILEHVQTDGQTRMAVLDVGVASGVTTKDLAASLERHDIAHEIVAVDQYLHAKLVAIGPWIDVLLTSNGEVLQVRAGSAVQFLPQGPVRWKRALAHAGLGVMNLLARVWPGSPAEVTLVSRSLRDHPSIEFVEQDIHGFRPDWAGRFDVVRAANILNRSYFSTERLASMLGVLIRYLRDDGILAVCRTDEVSGESDGSVFRREPGEATLKEVGRIGSGSEVSDIVLGTRVS
jgi:hypothetical protein